MSCCRVPRAFREPRLLSLYFGFTAAHMAFSSAFSPSSDSHSVRKSSPVVTSLCFRGVCTAGLERNPSARSTPPNHNIPCTFSPLAILCRAVPCRAVPSLFALLSRTFFWPALASPVCAASTISCPSFHLFSPFHFLPYKLSRHSHLSHSISVDLFSPTMIEPSLQWAAKDEVGGAIEAPRDSPAHMPSSTQFLTKSHPEWHSSDAFRSGTVSTHHLALRRKGLLEWW